VAVALATSTKRVPKAPKPTEPKPKRALPAPSPRAAQPARLPVFLKAPQHRASAAVAEPAAESSVQTGAATSAQSDHAFQAVIRRVKLAGRHQKVHPPAARKVAELHAAAVGPKNEVSSFAAARQTDKMDQQQPKPFDRAAFKAALLKKIADTAPKTLEDADNFKGNGKLDGVKSDMASTVSQEKQQSQSDVAQATAEKPDPSGITPKPVTALPATDPGQSSAISAAGAEPKRASDAAVSLDEGPKKIDREMADAGVNEEQLKTSNEPEFNAALSQKKDAQVDAVQSPKEFRKQEQVIIAGAKREAQGIASKDAVAMHSTRKAALSKVAAQQLQHKLEEEKKRQEVANHIEGIYQKTQTKVETRLKKLDDDINRTFDSGASQAQAAFEDYVEMRMDAYKDDRYSGWTGGLKWGKDKLFGMPDEVNEFYQTGHDRYIDDMDKVLDRIATMVETGLNDAKNIIADGRKEIQTYVDGLPHSLQDVGKKAAADIQNKFDGLEQTVNDKQGQLIDSLAKKYNDNLSKLNDRIEELKAKNRGLVDGAIAAIKGVIKTILALKDMLLNVLSRVADAIGTIIAHPIRFLGNLVDAGKTGFNNFSANIVEHLKKGFLEWLFGAVAETGIELPKSFDEAGILSLILQVLGLTYANIRARAVNILGEKVVAALETASEIFKILITKGPGGLWEYIKEKISDLKAMVLDKIKSFIMEEVLIAGITWIIGLLNPVSAFIKACKAIYSIIMFFVEHGKQIIDLVNSIIDSISLIAKGAIGAAAGFVERSLAKTIPVAIGFLAALLGVGGITGKIQSVIHSIQAPVNAAIDWVIKKAASLVKGVAGLLGFGPKATPEKKPAETQAGMAPGADVKEAARHMLAERLHGQQPGPQVDAAVAEVFRALQPHGLRRLEVAEQEEEDSFEVIGEASPPEVLLMLTPVLARVRMIIYLRAARGQDLTEGTTLPKFTQTRTVGGDTLSTAQLPPVGLGSKASQSTAGAIVVEPDRPDRLEMVTYNTGDPRPQSNPSHAERQFTEWFESQDKMHARLRHIRVLITHSPCPHCAQSLCHILNDSVLQKRIKSGEMSASLVYENAFRSTTADDISDLRKCGWSVQGPAITKKRRQKLRTVGSSVGSYTLKASRTRR
jgi:Skp family chaperone for outer membrane proteins